MKAIIFNSGIGKRMGELTKNNHKSMVKLCNGETIFERQIRILSECGIEEFIITTGLYEEKFREITEKPPYQKYNFIYVNNPIYDKTNYIYSFYLAKDYLDDDFIMIHGDLVFNKGIAKKIINSKYESCVTVDKTKKLPEKDFKGRIVNNKLKEVSIHIFDNDCFALQPFYKLSKKDINTWMNNVIDFIENRHIDGVYAENAMNEVSDKMNISSFDCKNDFVEEIDNLEDYEKVKIGIQEFDYKEQEIKKNLNSLLEILTNLKVNKPFVVIDSFLVGEYRAFFEKNNINQVLFDKFQPNPLYEDVVEAIKMYKLYSCDCLISMGGGSAIDTAKAMKLFLPLDETKNYLEQEHRFLNIKHIAIPTTAGTGSESTRYSVIYYKGNKQSLHNDCILPDYVILDSQFLSTLPLKQKKATVFDALCQSIESIWSVNSNHQSIEYAKESISLILENIGQYLNNNQKVYDNIFKAANLSGKAINITQTTAAHAMSYKITSLYGIPHGQAVAICLPGVWKYLLENYENTFDTRGSEDLFNRLNLIENLFSKYTSSALNYFKELLNNYEMYPFLNIKENLVDLISSVNLDRLKNFPVIITEKYLSNIYSSLEKKN